MSNENNQAEGQSDQQRVVMHHFRVMISRLDTKQAWRLTSNPAWCSATRACNSLLRNFANDYAEYKNCGVVHRMIRVEDCRDYGIDLGDIRAEFTLNPNDA